MNPLSEYIEVAATGAQMAWEADGECIPTLLLHGTLGHLVITPPASDDVPGDLAKIFGILRPIIGVYCAVTITEAWSKSYPVDGIEHEHVRRGDFQREHDAGSTDVVTCVVVFGFDCADPEQSTTLFYDVDPWTLREDNQTLDNRMQYLFSGVQDVEVPAIPTPLITPSDVSLVLQILVDSGIIGSALYEPAENETN